MTRRTLAILVGAALAMTGCTAIPHDSTPSAVASLPLEQVEATRVPGPLEGALPRDVVAGFLNANTLANPSHDGANQFLTTQAQQRWDSDSNTVTVVSNLHVGVFDGSTNSVPVTGTQVGTVDRAGIYTPALTGTGTGAGGQQLQFPYVMKQVNGQWRIDNLRPGLLLDAGQFGSSYRQHALYFFDVAEKHLVPDPRWFAPRDAGDVAQALIAALAAGPRDALQSAETTELPAINSPANVLVTVGGGGATKVEIPGASSLGADNRNRLAAQVAQTLSQIVSIGQIEITDNQKPVLIPRVGSAVFNADQVTSSYLATVAPPGLYYVRSGQGGGVFYQSGARLPGNIGKGFYGLDSVALANRPNTTSLLVAGTREHGTALDIGT